MPIILWLLGVPLSVIVLLFLFGIFCSPAQYCLYPGQKFSDAERFDQIIISPQLQAENPIKFFRFGRKHQNRNN